MFWKIMTFISGTITAVATLASNIMTWVNKRAELNNTAPMQAAKTNQLEANAQAKTAEAIKGKDANEIRNELAE
jgi:Flp pilus assembly protein TadB